MGSGTQKNSLRLFHCEHMLFFFIQTPDRCKQLLINLIDLLRQKSDLIFVLHMKSRFRF